MAAGQIRVRAIQPSLLRTGSGAIVTGQSVVTATPDPVVRDEPQTADDRHAGNAQTGPSNPLQPSLRC